MKIHQTLKTFDSSLFSSLRIVAVSIFLIQFYGCSTKKNNSIPNVILILADDLGYGELGIYGQHIIETPNIDQLSKEGIRFLNSYSGSPVCAPARAVILTGKHTGNTHIRGNDEWAERGDVWNFSAMFNDSTLEGQRPLLPSETTVAQWLKKRGYATGMVGKWGLGAPNTNSTPNKKGFDFFYGYNCQRQAHTYYPTHLWKNQSREILNNLIVTKKETIEEGSNPYDESSYIKFNQKEYSPELMHNQAMSFLEKNKKNPFFLYYASPLPHLPLQAPKKWVDYYVKKIGDEEPYLGDSYYPCRYPKATYAAMISYLDHQVGELIQKLKKMGVYENTLIIFTSDNGPSFVNHVDLEFFQSTGNLNNNRGRVKGTLYEGGIRVPLIVSWPKVIKESTVSNHITSAQDVFATIRDIVGSKKVSPNIDGLSFFPTLKSEKQKEHDFLYWEFPQSGGQQAIILDKWKGLKTGLQNEKSSLYLYDLSTDPKEEINLADKHTTIVNQMEKKLKEVHTKAKIKKFQIRSLDKR